MPAYCGEKNEGGVGVRIERGQIIHDKIEMHYYLCLTGITHIIHLILSMFHTTRSQYYVKVSSFELYTSIKNNPCN